MNSAQKKATTTTTNKTRLQTVKFHYNFARAVINIEHSVVQIIKKLLQTLSKSFNELKDNLFEKKNRRFATNYKMRRNRISRVLPEYMMINSTTSVRCP